MFGEQALIDRHHRRGAIGGRGAADGDLGLSQRRHTERGERDGAGGKPRQRTCAAEWMSHERLPGGSLGKPRL